MTRIKQLEIQLKKMLGKFKYLNKNTQTVKTVELIIYFYYKTVFL